MQAILHEAEQALAAAKAIDRQEPPPGELGIRMHLERRAAVLEEALQRIQTIAAKTLSQSAARSKSR